MLSTILAQLLAASCVLASPYPLPHADGEQALESRDNPAIYQPNVLPMGEKRSSDDDYISNLQPSLAVESGCPYYAAVDESGKMNNGLEKSETCIGGDNKGGQVYARYYDKVDGWSEFWISRMIIYTWYFPDRGSNYKPGADYKKHDWQQVVLFLHPEDVSKKPYAFAYSTPDGYVGAPVPAGQDWKPAFKVVTGPKGRSIQPDDKGNGSKQPLVVWNSIPTAPRDALNGHFFNDKNFDHDRCPLSDHEYDHHAKAAYKTAAEQIDKDLHRLR